MAGAVAELDGRALQAPEAFVQDIAARCRPVVLRGLIAGWPAVTAGMTSPAALRDYFLRFDSGRAFEAFFGDRAIAGKYYYRAGLKGFNFERRTMNLGEALAVMIGTAGKADTPSVYAGSLSLAAHLPGFAQENAVAILPANLDGRLWVGHESNVSCHYDTFENIACVVAGRRRFTLYPPELIGSLYVGPIDNTMAGQPVSLAASAPPEDAGKYPLFDAVRDQALVAELEPGDALFLPKLWWHQVEGTAPFNAMVNYWWDAFAAGPDAPSTALLLAMIAIAERPEGERAAWKAWFDHYVFRSAGHPLRHLPPELHGSLGPLKPDNYARLRAHIMRLLRGG
jgi:hypothetical protein